MVPSLWALWGEDTSNEQWPLPALLSGKSADLPQTHTLKLNNSVLPCMSLVSFKLLLQHWSSEGVSLSPCTGPLRGTPEVSIFLRLNSCCFLQREVMGTSLPGVGLGPLAPQLQYPS